MEQKAYRILCIDDEPDLLEIMSLQLEQVGCVIEKAGNGLEGLTILKNTLAQGQSFDVIVSDLNMPQMSGMVLLREIRSLGCLTPFIFFSGYGEKEKVLEAFRLGAFDFLDKPYNPQGFVNSVLRAAEIGSSGKDLDSSLKKVCEELGFPTDQIDSFRRAQEEILKNHLSKKK